MRKFKVFDWQDLAQSLSALEMCDFLVLTDKIDTVRRERMDAQQILDLEERIRIALEGVR